MATEVVKIVDTNGAADPVPDYTSLSAFLSGEARNLVTADEISVAKCRCSAGAADTTQATISATWVTDSTRYIKIWTDPSEGYRHNGTYQTGNKYRMETTVTCILSSGSGTRYIRVIGLQFKITSTGAWKYCYYVQTAASQVYFEQNVCVAVATGAAANWFGIRCLNSTNYVSNNLFYDWINGADSTLKAILAEGITYAYSNTFVNCYYGLIKSGNNACHAKNNLAQDCVDGFYYTSGGFHANSTNNCSDIVDDAPGSNPQTGDVTFAGSGDYHLSPTDTVAKDHGADLSADASYPISVDIDGVLRVAPWDIGADEVPGGTVSWGAATATGCGTVELDAIVSAVGSAEATGLGTAQLAAFVIAAGVATATGRGIAKIVAAITVSASASATGCGTASCIAWVQQPGGSATATGRGTVEIDAIVWAVVSAELTGLGSVELIAAVTHSAAGVCTGRGTASCDAWVLEPGAHATATGRGFAWCHLSEVYFAPLARHFGVRCVSSTHSATRSCESEDERLCGARRLN